MRPHDEDGLNDSPWYVRALVRVGVPTAFSAALLWFLMTNITGTLGRLEQTDIELAKTQVQVIENQARIIELLREAQNDQQMNAAVLLALCYNSAQTDAERLRCREGSQ